MKATYNYMTPQQLEEIIAEIPTLNIRKWKDKDIEFLFRNLYWMALRPMEGISLCKEDFNLLDHEVRLGHTKTERQGKVTIPVPYIPRLSSYLETKKEGRLCPGLTYPPFYIWLKKLGRICDIEAWTTPERESGEETVGHIFRKSMGKDMIEGTHNKKFSYEIISKHLRHSKPSTTINYYLKSSNKAVRDAWES